jgi:hypothetical protein
MNIEKGQVFVLSESPKVVGIVVSVQDTKKDRWVVQTTTGAKLVWNNVSETWRGAQFYSKLSEDTLLVPNEDIDLEVEVSTEPKDINVGELWTVIDSDSKVLILDEDYEEEPTYKAIVYDANGDTMFISFDGYGMSKSWVGIQLDEVHDTLFDYMNLF